MSSPNSERPWVLGRITRVNHRTRNFGESPGKGRGAYRAAIALSLSAIRRCVTSDGNPSASSSPASRGVQVDKESFRANTARGTGGRLR
jgi:hypothetical protein